MNDTTSFEVFQLYQSIMLHAASEIIFPTFFYLFGDCEHMFLKFSKVMQKCLCFNSCKSTGQYHLRCLMQWHFFIFNFDIFWNFVNNFVYCIFKSQWVANVFCIFLEAVYCCCQYVPLLLLMCCINVVFSECTIFCYFYGEHNVIWYFIRFFRLRGCFFLV